MPAIIIKQRLCKRCSICTELCPEGIPDPDTPLMNSHNCRLCRLCELYCPDFAISVYTEVDSEGQRTHESMEDDV